MKIIAFTTFLLFSYACGEIHYSSDEISEQHERKLYDVQQFTRDAVKTIGTAETLDRRKEFLIYDNVPLNLKLLNALNIINVFIDSITNAKNNTCFEDLSYIKEHIDLNDFQNSWAVKMLDSFGKPESGILRGNFKWLGDFDECRSIYAPKNESRDIGGFNGQYCTLQVIMAQKLPLSVGVCLPDTCNPSDFKDVFNISNLALNETGIGLNITSLTCTPRSLELSAGGIVTLCIVSLFLFLVLMGSSITAFKHFIDSNTSKDPNKCSASEENESLDNVSKNEANGSLEELVAINERSPTKLRVIIDKCEPFLNCFCIFTNGSKLLNTDSTEGQLLCLHGIRFLSMTWVIMGHVYTSPMNFIRYMEGVIPLLDNLPFQAVLNGWYSVDSFFVISGFLMAYLYFQECAKRGGKTPWLYFYVHRYLRLTPVYMIVLAFFTTIMPLMGSGPLWATTNVDPSCHKGWWWNLLYINNFQKQLEMCMGWSWYLANDMQFFIISPLFLISLWRSPIVGYVILALFLFGTWLTGFLITYHYDLVAGTLSNIAKLQDPVFITRWEEYMDRIYVKPYARIGPYLIGIILGYFLFKRKITNIKVDKITLWAGWFLAASVGLYCMYGVYHQTPSLVAACFYNALSRTGFGLSLSWVIFVCLIGQGGVVNQILSYKLFIPLSRLTYSAYLIHQILIFIHSLKTTIIFTHQTVVLNYLGLLIVTYACSILVSLAFESPIIRVEKLIRTKFQKK